MKVSYPIYRTTELEWLKEIPEHWTYGGITKFLDSIVDYRGKTPEKVEEGIFLVTARNIKNGIIDYELSQEFVKAEDYADIMRRGKPKVGDVLFTTEAPLGEVANIDNEDIALAQRVIKFRGLEGILDNYYLKYWIWSHPFQENLKTFATGSTAAGIKASKLSSLQILIPTIEEQRKIVEFLEIERMKVNDMIRLKFRLTELLEEKRQSIITEAVTKGLNSKVKMKDSGVEWIGEIPEHWKMIKIKYLVSGKLSYGANEAAEMDDENLPRYIRITDITDKGDLKANTFKSVPLEIANRYPVGKGDVLLARSGATVGKSYIHNSKVSASYAGYLIKLSFSNYLLANYIYLFTNSSIYKEWINSILIQATIQNVSAEKYGNLKVPIPSDTEIKEIVEYLNEINTNYRDLISKVENHIEKLKEYRQSLIYEAVTGKIDVRELISEK